VPFCGVWGESVTFVATDRSKEFRPSIFWCKKAISFEDLSHLSRKYPEEKVELSSSWSQNQNMNVVALNRELINFDIELFGILSNQMVDQLMGLG
jgi:hypothetical protein